MVTHKKGTFFPPFIHMKSPSSVSTSTNRKTATLDIVGFDDREQRHPPGFDLPPWMPMHEFFMLIVAPAGCGKTTLILNLLLRIYRAYFNKIIVFSPTIHNDQKWKHLTSNKNVLRPNKHKKRWLPKVKEHGDDGHHDTASSDAQKYTEEMSIAYEIITYVSKVLYTARKEGGRHWYASNRLEIAYNHRCLLCYLFYRALTL